MNFEQNQQNYLYSYSWGTVDGKARKTAKKVKGVLINYHNNIICPPSSFCVVWGGLEDFDMKPAYNIQFPHKQIMIHVL